MLDFSDHALTQISTVAEVAILAFMVWEKYGPRLRGGVKTASSQSNQSGLWPTLWENKTIIVALVGLGIVGWLQFRQPSQTDLIEARNAAISAQADLAVSAQRVQTLEHSLIDAQAERDQLKQQLVVAAHQPPPPPPPEDQIPIRWNTNIQMLWSGGGSDAQMNGFRFTGQSTALAHIKDAYILSHLTGHKQQLEVFTPYNGEHIPIDQIEPIPSGAAVWLVAEWKPPLSLKDFLGQWNDFEFDVIYDDRKFTRRFDQDYINQKMMSEMSGVFGPRVTKKSGDK